MALPGAIPPPFALGITGTSLTTGRLGAGWVALLNKQLPCQPEAKGPIRVYDLGHGGWTSADILLGAPTLSALKPSHILAESGDINDCFDGGSGPQISRAQKITNQIAMINEWRNNIPGVEITFQTMSSVSAATAVGRPTLADYYADTVATAVAQGVAYIDNYAAWPKPLNAALTDSNDGLHPIFTGAVDTYLYPTVLAWARARMAAYWAAF